MAVSHQWFLQWSSPSVVFADISRQYENVQSNWNNHHHYGRVAYNPVDAQAAIRNSYREKQIQQQRVANNIIKYDRHRSLNVTDRSRPAALTLWLAMLGLARPQSVPADTDTPPFSTLYKWKTIDFEFPSVQHRRSALISRAYIPSNVLPLGLEVWGSRVWVTLPSWRRGVPATLATVSRGGGVTSPALKPYPDWNYHRAFSDDVNCFGLTSVFRVSADQCGKLWVLDSGQIDSQDSPKQICPPSVVVFNMQTDSMIAKYPIPEEYVLQDSLFSNIIVDSRQEDCSDLHLYIADTWRFGLLVFRHSDQKFWRFSHHLFYPDPLASNYTLHGLNFQWADGIFGLSLSPINNVEERTMYFHSMSSYREFSVTTDVLRQPARVNDSANAFKIVGESRGLFGQSSASAMDRNGVMFYGLVSRDSIGCWDSQKPYNKKTMGVVAMNTETLVFPNDIKIDQEQQQSVWVISNRLPMFQDGSLSDDDYNYRIMYVDTTQAVQGTICDPQLQLPPYSPLVTNKWLP
ncbi:protein yellow-like isoform X1 [Papilio machaon]|uniref:protein yellow-like isoform X1 n=1 Tax=Papilio machaon TaxID=76193 RepID=UPI001E6642E1|nr:protein yellow-like isoform X1 [Papilio machaon]